MEERKGLSDDGFSLADLLGFPLAGLVARQQGSRPSSCRGRNVAGLLLWETKIVSVCCALLSHSVVSDSATPRTVAHQSPLSVGFSRSGLPCPPPGESYQLREKTQVSRIAGRFFIVSSTREAQEYWSG